MVNLVASAVFLEEKTLESWFEPWAAGSVSVNATSVLFYATPDKVKL